MTKNTAINVLILANVAKGMSPRDAFDAVLGSGAYEKMAGLLYDALRANAAK